MEIPPIDKVQNAIAVASQLRDTAMQCATTLRYFDFIDVTNQIKQLQFFYEAWSGDTYLDEKIGEMEWHFGAIAGVRETNGHPINQHALWAARAADSYKRQVELACRESWKIELRNS